MLEQVEPSGGALWDCQPGFYRPVVACRACEYLVRCLPELAFLMAAYLCLSLTFSSWMEEVDGQW